MTKTIIICAAILVWMCSAAPLQAAVAQDISREMKDYLTTAYGNARLVKDPQILLYTDKKDEKSRVSLMFCVGENEIIPLKMQTERSGIKSISYFIEEPGITRLARFDILDKTIHNVEGRYRIRTGTPVVVVVETENGVFYNHKYMRIAICCYGG